MLQINNEIKGFVALNPLQDVYHIGEVTDGCYLATGQPLLIVCDTLPEAIEHCYIDYDVEALSGTPRPLDWLVCSTEAEAKAIASVISTFPRVAMNAIPHPNTSEWLIAYSDYFLSIVGEGAEKDALVTALSAYLPTIQTTEQILA